MSRIQELIGGFVPSFHIVNLGCKVNRVEADTLAAALMAVGARPVELEDAGLVVVNTCTVTGEADKKARKAVRHALASNRHAVVLVTGCAVAIDAGTFSAMDGRVRVVGRMELADAISRVQEPLPGEAGEVACPREESRAGIGLRDGEGLLQLGKPPIDQYLHGEKQPDRGGSPSPIRPPRDAGVRSGEAFRTRVNIKAQDGCDHACTYCIVHVARGPARSTPASSVIADARLQLRSGAREIVLTGIDLGSYHDGGTDTAELARLLVNEARAVDPACALPARVRASSLEPNTISEAFIDLLAESDGALCRHLHLPLQSGSSKVLGEMGRLYDAREYSELVRHLRDRIPQLSLTTDIIVGFPGETDADFERTLALAEECAFSKIHVFPYSKREGTPAAARDDQVDPDAKRRRAATLRSLSARLRSADLAVRAGTTEYVLVEPDGALTESYHTVSAPMNAETGSLVEVRLR